MLELVQELRGLMSSEMKRLRRLEEENGNLQKIAAPPPNGNLNGVLLPQC